MECIHIPANEPEGEDVSHTLGVDDTFSESPGADEKVIPFLNQFVFKLDGRMRMTAYNYIISGKKLIHT